MAKEVREGRKGMPSLTRRAIGQRNQLELVAEKM